MAGLRLPATLDTSLTSELLPFRCIYSYSSTLPVLKPSLTAALRLSPALLVTCSKDNVRHPVSRVGKSPSKTKHHTGHRRTPALMRWNKWKQARLIELGAPGFLHVSANSKADDSIPSEMTLENALKLLGVGEGASFDEILRAKKAMLARHNEDQDVAIQVEAAYDLLLMQSLTQRRAGKVVDNSILYADVKKAKSTSTSLARPEWLRSALSKSPVAVESPSASAVATQTAVYAALMVWTFASGLSSSPGDASLNTNADVPGLILAIGFGSSLYFLRKQNVNLGKSAALTVAGLVAGAVFGGAIESWLRVDLIPVFGIGSPAVIVSEFVLLSLWLSSLYLR